MSSPMKQWHGAPVSPFGRWLFAGLITITLGEAQPASAVPDSGTWSPLSVGGSAADYSGSLTLDTRRNRVFLLDGIQLRALELANPVAWVGVPATGTSLGNRDFALTVYDSLEDRVYVSCGGTPTNTVFRFTFDDASGSSGSWSQLSTNPSPAGFPAPRYGHGGIFDPVRREVVFYGGYSSGCQYSISVWALPVDGVHTWRNVSTAGFGGGVFCPVVGYDALRRQMHVYGGFYHVYCGKLGVEDNSANTLAGFELDGNSWIPYWPNTAGPIDHEHPMAGAYDSRRDRVLAMAYPSLLVAYSFVEAHWDTLTPVGPGPSLATAALYDPIGDRLLVWDNYNPGWWFLTFSSTSAATTNPPPPETPGLQARPNPMRTRTSIHFELESAGAIDLSVVDVRGRRLATLRAGFMSVGHHVVHWNATDDQGRRLARGLYFIRLRFPGGSRASRVLVLD